MRSGNSNSDPDPDRFVGRQTLILIAAALAVPVAVAVPTGSLWRRAKRSRRESRSSPFVSSLKFPRDMQPESDEEGSSVWVGVPPAAGSAEVRR